VNPTEILVVPDIHFPYHDEAAWGTVVSAIRKIKPDRVVFLGDAIDCYVVSHFDRSPTRFPCLADELAVARKQLARVEADAVTILEGNHEYRLFKFLRKNAPALLGMISIPEELRLKERGWEWIPYPKNKRIGDVVFQHEPLLGGKYGAKRTLENGGGLSWCFGHTHAGEIVHGGTTEGRPTFSLNAGWLGDFSSLAFEYMPPVRARQTWRHGFGRIVQRNGRTIHAEFVPIIRGACVVDGRTVRG
jgi:predicted phosphodiesterase